jgi:hypothetical protein
MVAIELSHGVVERGGFEPPKAKPTDLQSAPFDRFGTSPAETSWAAPSRPTVLKEKIKSDESPPSRSLVPRDREGKPWAVRFRRTRPRESRCARWWLLFGPGVRPGGEVSETAGAGSMPRRVGAGDGTRTRNLLITNQLLYPLSYASGDDRDSRL